MFALVLFCVYCLPAPPHPVFWPHLQHDSCVNRASSAQAWPSQAFVPVGAGFPHLCEGAGVSVLKRPWLLLPPVTLQERCLPVTFGEMVSEQQPVLSSEDTAAAGPGGFRCARRWHHSGLEMNDGSIFSGRGGKL